MTTATIERPAVRKTASDVLTSLRASHRAAADIVADLDLDDARLWAKADGIVAAIAAEAYGMAVLMTGEPAGTAATGVPPIVRVRELAAAHRRLFAAVDRQPTLDERSLSWASRSAHRAHVLCRQLRRLALST